jgi:hypothetical protein
VRALVNRLRLAMAKTFGLRWHSDMVRIQKRPTGQRGVLVVSCAILGMCGCSEPKKTSELSLGDSAHDTTVITSGEVTVYPGTFIHGPLGRVWYVGVTDIQEIHR